MTTNAPPIIPYLDKVLEWNEQLLGLPALPLVVIGCIAFGYFLKAWKGFENQKIPSRVILAGMLLYVGISLESLLDVYEKSGWSAGAIKTVAWLIRNAVLGLIGGVAAIIIHRLLLKKLETKFGWFPTGNTIEWKKSDINQPPPPKT